MFGSGRGMNRQQRRQASQTPDAYYWRGRACIDQQDYKGALAAFERAIKLEPGKWEYHRALGLVLAKLERYVEAAAAHRRSIALNGGFAKTHRDLGVALLKDGKPNQAVKAFEQALLLDPFDEHAKLFLGMAHAQSGVPARALELLDDAVRDSDDPDIHSQRAWAMLKQGRVEESIAAMEHGLSLNPKHLALNSNLMFAIQHRIGMDAASLYEAHRKWNQRVMPEEGADRPSLARRRLSGLPTIGIVSGDLRRHAVTTLTLPAFEALSRRGFPIVCFANQDFDDDLSDRLKAIARKWQRVEVLSDTELRALILGEEIDILFDLSGLTNKHRMGVFQDRSAPVQVTWAGYVGTTGITAMDGLIADEREVPLGEDQFYTEQVIRLPDCYTIYEPPDDAPEVEPPPSPAAGHITFGAFHRLPKINLDVARVWAKIFAELPDAKLLLHYGGFEEQQAQSVFRRMFEAAGVPLDCVIFEAGGSRGEMLKAYHRVDVFLDTWPYSGGVTTLEASWMGVPVVTLPGNSFAGRHSKSHLTAIGMTETIATSKDQYARLAIDLARDIERRTELRRNLRQMVRDSPLFDHDTFARHLGDALLALWDRKVEDAERSRALTEA